MEKLLNTSGIYPEDIFKNIWKRPDLPGEGAAPEITDKEIVLEKKDDAHSGNGDEDQTSQADLRDLDATSDAVQPSPGNLNHTTEDLDDWTQEEVEIGRIEHFVELPDYMEERAARRPRLVNDGERYWCIDGWSPVEEPQAEGRTITTCWVRNIPHCSTARLALEKLAVRTAPMVFGAVYAELVRNTVRVEALFLRSDKELRAFSHGGARRGEAYAARRMQDVRRMIAKRLNKDPEQISRYSVYGSYLSDNAFETLIRGKASRLFFETAQPYKKDLAGKLEEELKSEDEITLTVSAAMLEWFGRYSASGTIEDIVDTSTAEIAEAPEPAQGPSQRQSRARRASAPVEHRHHTPQEEPAVAEGQPETREAMNLEVEAVREELLTIITDATLANQTFAERLARAGHKLVEISVRVQRSG